MWGMSKGPGFGSLGLSRPRGTFETFETSPVKSSSRRFQAKPPYDMFEWLIESLPLGYHAQDSFEEQPNDFSAFPSEQRVDPPVLEDFIHRLGKPTAHGHLSFWSLVHDSTPPQR